MKNIGKIAKTAHASGKDWRREICHVFLTNYRATPHSSMKKSPYELLVNRSIRTKIPEIISSNSSLEIASNNGKPIKKKMKMYTDFSRKTKDHGIKCGDIVLVRQRKWHKLSTSFEPNPYLVETVKGTMVTASRVTDETKIMRNSSPIKQVGKSSLANFKFKIADADEESWDFEDNNPIEMDEATSESHF